MNDWQPQPSCNYIDGDFKVDPPVMPSCTCGAVYPMGIKTGGAGWFFGHVNYGWDAVS